MWQAVIILTDKEWKKTTTLTSEKIDTIEEALAYLNALVKHNSKEEYNCYYIDYLLEEIKK